MVAKIAYLTIDDGPSKDMKNKVDYLVSKSIPAVWFLTGKRIEENPEAVIHAIKKGFIIGNHSYSHKKFSDLTLEQCFLEIQKTDEIINGIYKNAGIKRPAKFFRFPYGDKGGLKYEEVFETYEGEGKIRKEKIQDFLRRHGYNQPKFGNITYKYYRKAGLLDDADWHWTYDVMEYAIYDEKPRFGIDSIEKVYARMDESVPEGCRGLNYPDSEEIILIHDMNRTIGLFIPIMERLLAMGIIFKLPPVDFIF